MSQRLNSVANVTEKLNDAIKKIKQSRQWQRIIKNFGIGILFKELLYLLDIGTDAYNTYQLHQDCHYNWFYVSLVLILLPNLVTGLYTLIVWFRCVFC